MSVLLLLLLSYISFNNAYDENLSKHCVDLSQASYCVSSIDKWTCITCDPSVKLEYIVENSDSKAIQGYDSLTNTIFTAFRGSSNLHNLVTISGKRILSPLNWRLVITSCEALPLISSNFISAKAFFSS